MDVNPFTLGIDTTLAPTLNTSITPSFEVDTTATPDVDSFANVQEQFFLRVKGGLDGLEHRLSQVEAHVAHAKEAKERKVEDLLVEERLWRQKLEEELYDCQEKLAEKKEKICEMKVIPSFFGSPPTFKPRNIDFAPI